MIDDIGFHSSELAKQYADMKAHADAMEQRLCDLTLAICDIAGLPPSQVGRITPESLRQFVVSASAMLQANVAHRKAKNELMQVDAVLDSVPALSALPTRAGRVRHCIKLAESAVNAKGA